jgi:hypothetical protein
VTPPPLQPALPPDRMAILRDAVHRHSPAMASRLGTLGAIALNDEEREALRNAVLRELLESGLGDDDEPNGRGLDLEAIVDDLGRL